MKFKNIAAVTAALAVTVTMSGCAAAVRNEEKDETEIDIADNLGQTAPEEVLDVPSEILPERPAEQPVLPEINEVEEPTEDPVEENPTTTVKPVETVQPKVQTMSYISVTASGVNFRSGAGTNYSVSGQAEKNTLYAYLGEAGGWYKTYYKNKTVYISKNYCVIVDMPKSDNEKIEAVIAEGTRFLGTPYVYGAVRLHDGNGNMLKNFTTSAFDCSSLMQYMFYYGAGKLLNVNTRTQIYQGTTISKANLKRGDLMFFTNASRYYNTGIERVGHVAIYLGDNYILHTASDYAKIEQISSTRWGYFIQAQRMI